MGHCGEGNVKENPYMADLLLYKAAAAQMADGGAYIAHKLSCRYWSEIFLTQLRHLDMLFL